MVKGIPNVSVAGRDLGGAESQGIWVDLISQVSKTAIEDGENFLPAVRPEGDNGGAEMEVW